MGVAFSQLFPPTPSLTEKNLPSLRDRVFIVTGGYSGVGLRLVEMLYLAVGKVYIAGRSEAKALQGIESVKATVRKPEPSASLHFLQLTLDDLTTIKASVDYFKSKESRLDILFNNAGVSLPSAGSKSRQGHELQLATNCLGPMLFTQLLIPCLEAAANNSTPGAVRIVWTSSQMVDISAPKGGLLLDDLVHTPSDQQRNYTNSKIGNWFIAVGFAHLLGSRGILSVVQNPGNLKTNLLRDHKLMRAMSSPLLHPAKMGAYTELWAGLSPSLTMELNGSYVIPWGRVHPSPRPDLINALKSTEDGGTGVSKKFWDFCKQHIKEFE
ncbi:MAG: hypothetical protein LQ351_000172 [Letrouitia transgressa]|nr:MAG: hypothetical protein LQ351_000172 [Letrouitia transgressa]